MERHGHDYVRVGEAAQRLGLTPQIVRRLVNAGVLPATRPPGPGTHRRIKRADVDRLGHSMRTAGAALRRDDG